VHLPPRPVAQVGLFSLWNGTSFQFEAMQQAHDRAVRALAWSPDQRWLVSGDHGGLLKYWQPTLNNVKQLVAHEGVPVRQLSFAPSGRKVASCADEGPIKVWDFETCALERKLQVRGRERGGVGRGGDVCVAGVCIACERCVCLALSFSLVCAQPLSP
jgi:WD40 repeat protein